MNFLSRAILILLLAGTPHEEGRPILPMGAHLKEDPVHGYEAPRPEGFTVRWPKETYVFHTKDDPFIVWEAKGMWFRVTPPDFPKEVWVDGNLVSLDQELSVSKDPPYLGRMRAFFRELEERSHITGCTVVLETVSKVYPEPSPNAEPFNFIPSIEYRPGTILPVHRQRDGWYEVYVPDDPTSLSSGWIPSKGTELTTTTFSEGNDPCQHSFTRENTPMYTFARSGVYRFGPSPRLGEVTFYKVGEPAQVVAESSTGWLATNIKGLETLAWFPASDAIKSLPFPVSGFTTEYNSEFHRDPRSESELLCRLNSNGYVILYEKFSSSSEVWYRTTPDGFWPTAWISARQVRIEPLRALAPSEIEKEYLEYLSQHYPRIAESTSAPASEASSSSGIRTCGVFFFLGLLLAFVLYKIFRYAARASSTPSMEGEHMKLVRTGESSLKQTDKDSIAAVSPGTPPAIITPPSPHPLENTFLASFFPAAQDFIAKWIRKRADVVKASTEYNENLIDYKKSSHALNEIDKIAEIETAKRERELAAIKNETKIGNAETTGRVKDVELQSKIDEERHKTSVLKEDVERTKLDVSRAKYDLEKRNYESAGKEKPPQKQLSPEERLRSMIASQMSKEDARLKLLAEYRSQYEEEVRRRTITEERMEYYMARIEALMDKELVKGL